MKERTVMGMATKTCRKPKKVSRDKQYFLLLNLKHIAELGYEV